MVKKAAVKKAVKKAGAKKFASKAQAKKFFADPKLRKYAKKKAHATGMHSSVTKKKGFSPAYKALPKRKGVKKSAR